MKIKTTNTVETFYMWPQQKTIKSVFLLDTLTYNHTYISLKHGGSTYFATTELTLVLMRSRYWSICACKEWKKQRNRKRNQIVRRCEKTHNKRITNVIVGNEGFHWPGISRTPQAWKTWRPPLKQEITKVWKNAKRRMHNQKVKSVIHEENSKYVLTHNKKSESIEQSAHIGQQPHQHCKLKLKNKADG